MESRIYLQSLLKVRQGINSVRTYSLVTYKNLFESQSQLTWNVAGACNKEIQQIISALWRKNLGQQKSP